MHGKKEAAGSTSRITDRIVGLRRHDLDDRPQ
jgi:hypothetical protein